MKKIGLCVCYDTKNYGSQLQVLATCKKIQTLGYDYEIIRYKKKMTPQFLIKSLPRLLNPYFVNNKLTKRKKDKEINSNDIVKKQVKIRDERFKRFVEIYFTKSSKLYYGYNELCNNVKKYDGVLVGSDQLWLPSNLGSHFYTLEYVPKEMLKIAYATSFGVSQIPWYQVKRTKNYLNRIQYISSREIRGSELIYEIAGKKVDVVCDPTMLLTAEEWDMLIPERAVVKKSYILCYFLGDSVEHREVANNLKKDTGLEIVTLPFLDNFVEHDLSFGDQHLYDVDAADFVNLIRHADYILTDSFHGSIFSILNHKKFITLDRFKEGSKNSRNSRIDSLFSLLGLENRRYNGDIYTAIEKNIDYNDVDKKIEEFRSSSISYLDKALLNDK